MTRTLFVTYQHHRWDQAALDEAAATVSAALPEDVKVVLTPESLDFMTADEVEEYVGQLVEAVS